MTFAWLSYSESRLIIKLLSSGFEGQAIETEITGDTEHWRFVQHMHWFPLLLKQAARWWGGKADGDAGLWGMDQHLITLAAVDSQLMCQGPQLASSPSA